MSALLTIPTAPVAGAYTVSIFQQMQHLLRIGNNKTYITVDLNPNYGEYQTIQAAVTALSDTGGVIYIKEGIYDVSAEIVLPVKPWLFFGESADKSIINKDFSTASKDLFAITDPVNQITFSNLGFTHSSSCDVANYFDINCSSTFTTVINFLDCVFTTDGTGFDTFIDMLSVYKMNILNCTFDGAPGGNNRSMYAFDTQSPLNSTLFIDKCIFINTNGEDGASHDGIYTDIIQNFTIQNCNLDCDIFSYSSDTKVLNNTGISLQIYTGNAIITGNIFILNYVSGAASQVWCMNATSYSLPSTASTIISNNIFQMIGGTDIDSGQDFGMFFGGFDENGIQIVNNVIKVTTSKTNGFIYGLALSNCHYSRVQGNFISMPGTTNKYYTLKIYSGSTYINVVGNTWEKGYVFGSGGADWQGIGADNDGANNYIQVASNPRKP